MIQRINGYRRANEYLYSQAEELIIHDEYFYSQAEE